MYYSFKYEFLFRLGDCSSQLISLILILRGFLHIKNEVIAMMFDPLVEEKLHKLLNDVNFTPVSSDISNRKLIPKVVQFLFLSNLQNPSKAFEGSFCHRRNILSKT